VPGPYQEYRVPQVDRITDDARNILIVPKVKTSQIYEFPNITKCIWWLSVDNFFVAEGHRKKWKSIFGFRSKKIRKYDFSDIPRLYNFVQSRYAREFLKSKGIPSTRIEYLSDYLKRISSKRLQIALSKKKIGLPIIQGRGSNLHSTSSKQLPNLNGNQYKICPEHKSLIF
jgi:hypothetical protein